MNSRKRIRDECNGRMKFSQAACRDHAATESGRRGSSASSSQVVLTEIEVAGAVARAVLRRLGISRGSRANRGASGCGRGRRAGQRGCGGASAGDGRRSPGSIPRGKFKRGGGSGVTVAGECFSSEHHEVEMRGGCRPSPANGTWRNGVAGPFSQIPVIFVTSAKITLGAYGIRVEGCGRDGSGGTPGAGDGGDVSLDKRVHRARGRRGDRSGGARRAGDFGWTSPWTWRTRCGTSGRGRCCGAGLARRKWSCR